MEVGSYCMNCDSPLPAVGIFCPQCQAQIRCQQCREYLIPESRYCVYCGGAVGIIAQNGLSVPHPEPSRNSVNRIKLRETLKERTIEAEFSDKAAVDIAALWSVQGGTKLRPLAVNTPPSDAAKDSEAAEGSEALSSVIIDDKLTQPDSVIDVPLNFTNPLGRIFRLDGTKLTLRDTALKGTSAKDFRVRATALALEYLRINHAMESVPRIMLVDMIKSVDWFDTNYYVELKDKALFGIDDEERVWLSVEGEKQAQIFLQEKLDLNKASTPLPQVGRGKKGKETGSKPGSTAKTSSSGGKSTKTSTGSKAPAIEVGPLVAKWDEHRRSASIPEIKVAPLGRLEQILVVLYAVEAVQKDGGPVSRGILERFFREAFGISYSA